MKDRVNAIALAPAEDFGRDSDLFGEGVAHPDAQGRIRAAMKRGFQTREAEMALARMLGFSRTKAAELAAKSTHYQRMVKRLVWQSLDNSLADHLQLERHGIAESMGTEDLRDGVRDFLAGEQPTFHGR